VTFTLGKNGAFGFEVLWLWDVLGYWRKDSSAAVSRFLENSGRLFLRFTKH
jgi:hypothetical protein